VQFFCVQDLAATCDAPAVVQLHPLSVTPMAVADVTVTQYAQYLGVAAHCVCTRLRAHYDCTADLRAAAPYICSHLLCTQLYNCDAKAAVKRLQCSAHHPL
jgi:hypothetical protein